MQYHHLQELPSGFSQCAVSGFTQALCNQIKPGSIHYFRSGCSAQYEIIVGNEEIDTLSTTNMILHPLPFPLQVPDGVTVLMSASRSSYSKQDRVFQFSMEFPVPSYLVALVAGDLQHVDVGPRLVRETQGGLWDCGDRDVAASSASYTGVKRFIYGSIFTASLNSVRNRLVKVSQ